MKLGYVSTLLLGVGMLAFSGCSSTYIKVKEEARNDASGRFTISTMNHEDSTYLGTVHVVKNISEKFLIQSDAEATLHFGYRYFRIIGPFDSSDKMMTSPEELKKNCFSNGIFSSFVPIVPQCYGEYKYEPWSNTIISYKQRPQDVFVFDAEEVIEYLKANKIYVDTSKVFKNDDEKFEKMD